MQSGEDSPLRNTWDKIASAQSEESLMWGAYQDTIESIIQCEVDLIDLPTKKAIWLQTEGYEDWDEEDNTESVPWTDEDIVRYIRSAFVIPAAEGWHNRRIERYLDL